MHLMRGLCRKCQNENKTHKVRFPLKNENLVTRNKPAICAFSTHSPPASKLFVSSAKYVCSQCEICSVFSTKLFISSAKWVRFQRQVFASSTNLKCSLVPSLLPSFRSLSTRGTRIMHNLTSLPLHKVGCLLGVGTHVQIAKLASAENL